MAFAQLIKVWRVTVDGVDQPDNTVPLVDDHQEHTVEVSIPVVTG